uniref:Putative ovule protein n=1 Tax=Solanum chacoense TaxID=4108 RepID=A0A0V0I5T7_SOLCH
MHSKREDMESTKKLSFTNSNEPKLVRIKRNFTFSGAATWTRTGRGMTTGSTTQSRTEQQVKGLVYSFSNVFLYVFCD